MLQGGLYIPSVLRLRGRGRLIHKTASITADPANAVAGTMYLCDASGGSFTVTLPGSPNTDDCVAIAFITGSGSNTVTIGRNGNTIGGDSADYVLFVARDTAAPGDYALLRYDGSDWVFEDLRLVPHRVSMRATSNQTVTTAVAETIELGATDSDVGQLADLANNRAVLRRSGCYLIIVFNNIQSLTSGKYLQTWVSCPGGTLTSYNHRRYSGGEVRTEQNLIVKTEIDITTSAAVNANISHDHGSDRDTSAANTAIAPKLIIQEIR